MRSESALYGYIAGVGIGMFVGALLTTGTVGLSAWTVGAGGISVCVVGMLLRLTDDTT